MLSLDEKKFIIEKMGVDDLVLYPFNREFAQLAPEAFMDLLVKKQIARFL